MCYLQHRKERIGFLLLMVCTSLLWPFLAKANLDAQKFCLYVNDLFVKYQNFTVEARNFSIHIIFAKSLASEAMKILLCPFYT